MILSGICTPSRANPFYNFEDYLDGSEADKVTLPKLEPSTKTISLRLPESMVEELKILANKKDVPYQSLLKVFLEKRIDSELHHA